MIHENTLGKFIEKNRKERKISKTGLCRGLCSVSTLTRYEKDERIPEKVMADMLLERLGIKPYEFEFILSDDEFHQVMLRKKIENSIWNDSLETAKSSINEYRDSIKSCEMLHLQYVLLKEGEIAKREGNNDLALEKFKEALECTDVLITVKDKKSDMLFSSIEMELMFQQAECLYLTGEIKPSYVLFKALRNYMKEVCWDSEKHITYYPHILYRMSEFAYKESNFGMAEQMLMEARDELIREYQLSDLYEILALLKKVREKTGKKVTSEEEEFILALQIVNLENNGELTKEGIELWQNTINRQS